jgi:hypothetical protein
VTTLNGRDATDSSNALAHIHSNATVRDRCTLSPLSVVKTGAVLGEGIFVAAGEPKRSDRTSRGTCKTTCRTRWCGWGDG